MHHPETARHLHITRPPAVDGNSADLVRHVFEITTPSDHTLSGIVYPHAKHGHTVSEDKHEGELQECSAAVKRYSAWRCCVYGVLLAVFGSRLLFVLWVHFDIFYLGHLHNLGLSSLWTYCAAWRENKPVPLSSTLRVALFFLCCSTALLCISVSLAAPFFQMPSEQYRTRAKVVSGCMLLAVLVQWAIDKNRRDFFSLAVSMFILLVVLMAQCTLYCMANPKSKLTRHMLPVEYE